jgi:hypothetical protein
MIHAYEPESFRPPFYDGAIDPARSADGTIGDHDGGLADTVSYLMMITDDLDGVGPGFIVDNDADDKTVEGDLVGGGAGKSYGIGLIEHLIGLEAEIEGIENNSIEEDEYAEADGWPDGLSAGRSVTIGLLSRVDKPCIADEEKTGYSEPDAIAVDKIG